MTAEEQVLEHALRWRLIVDRLLADPHAAFDVPVDDLDGGGARAVVADLVGRVACEGRPSPLAVGRWADVLRRADAQPARGDGPSRPAGWDGEARAIALAMVLAEVERSQAER